MKVLDKWFLENVVCPQDKLPVKLENDRLICEKQHEYFLVEGIPVMLPHDTIIHTHTRASEKTFNIVASYIEGNDILENVANNALVDHFVQNEIVNTNSNLYKNTLGKLKEYPIPPLPLPQGNSQYFLDIGCNWGRWCIAASMAGYQPVGIDPSLESILSAKRVANQLGKEIRYIVADSRYMPFRDNFFDIAYSYSVFQHFSRENIESSLMEIHRVLKNGGQSKIHMLNTFGLRSMYVQSRRAFREGKDFETRYWTLRELKDTFNRLIGDSNITIASFFTQGQISDMHLFLWQHRLMITLSEFLKKVNEEIGMLINIADNVFVTSIKRK